jgi:BirA family biotin operon repressor/biotin-[acetyl-CoA-carboxylase] ligase
MCARPKRDLFKVSTTARVLGYLRGSDGYVSGQGISGELGLSRVAIWKHIRTLRAQGCRIDACRHRGYRLIGVPDVPTEEAVSAQLRTQTLGRPLLFFREVDSTNRQLAMRAPDTAEGMTLVADHQTAGRGRMGRAWFSPAGANVYLSVLLRPQVNLAQIATLPLVVGCVVARAVAKLAAEVPAKIKWPNDLHVNGRKLGGILCEMAAETDGVQHVVVGIGLNVNLRRSRLPTAIARSATSLAIETAHKFSRAEVVAEILNQLEPAYADWCVEGLEPFLPEIAALDLLKGRFTRVEQTGKQTVEGIADGINVDGTLRLRQPDGSHLAVCSGDAHVVPQHKPAKE